MAYERRVHGRAGPADFRAMAPESPFGDRRGGRLHRVLVYFGLRDGPEESTPPAPRAPSPDPETSRWQNALVYFGLAESTNTSRYGAAVSRDLDAEIDDLRRRLDALERDRRR